MKINQEKKEIINCSNNILVTANPGTGKTLLLAYKYVHLLENGYNPENILCLTFTRKARKEMEERITSLLQEKQIQVDISKILVHTFHSYALEAIEDADLVSSNLLRYTIYRYLKDHSILNYSDNYLLDTIVPKMENLIRYLKSFGITSEMIDKNQVRPFISDFKNYSKEELERFLDYFIKIFHHYEEIKASIGLDYSDMLIEYLKMNQSKTFDYVLVDELQDVNRMEAEIALQSAKQFIAVGDQKQAIFGFQGGSILNFKKFSDSNSFILSENFRSTNAILNYSRTYFSTKTKEKNHIKDLKNLQNKTQESGKKPIIYEIEKNELYKSASHLAKILSNKNEQVAIIARTNTQIMQIAKELSLLGLDYSSTFFSASKEAKQSVITFLIGILSNKTVHIKEAMFTPFFPITLQKAFNLCEKKYLSLTEIYTACPQFKNMKKQMGNLHDINKLFHKIIIPIAISQGEEYLLAALTVKDAFYEAMDILEHKTIDNLAAFLQSTDLQANESIIEKNIVLSTVHKAKGKQFHSVIYVPTKTQSKANFQDAVVKAILQSKNINAEEELEEETLRVNFVAFTRAKKELYILTDQVKEYCNNESDIKDFRSECSTENIDSEQIQKAFALFVNKDYDNAKKLLEQKQEWVCNFIRNHFDQIESLSFSALTTNAYDYLKQRILKIIPQTDSMEMGSEVHVLAEQIIEGIEYQVKESYVPYEKNIQILIDEIHENYPEDVFIEENITIALSDMVDTDENIKFTGKLDAVFKNDDTFLIVDWKTSKNLNYGSSHRQQLSAYKKAFSIQYKVPLEKIKVAIGYVGLKNTINDGLIQTKLDTKQPASSSLKTFEKKVQNVLSWKQNTHSFFEELKEIKNDDVLLRSILEQYKKETE